MKKTAVCIAVCLLILYGFLSARAVPSATIYCGAVNNEKVYPFTEIYMPLIFNDLILVPGAILTDSRIGFTMEWAPKSRYLTVNYNQKTITFEQGSRIAFDSEREYVTTFASTEKNGQLIFYFEMRFLAEYFGWSYSIINTNYGNILRIATLRVLDDQYYEQFSRQRMKENYDAYYSIQPSPGVSPSVSPSSTPSPTPVIPRPPLGVYLSFDGELDDNASKVADVLDSYGVKAMFFTDSASFTAFPSLTRRLVSTHLLGILSEYNKDADYDFYLNELNSANDVLRLIAFTKTRFTRILYLPSGVSSDIRDAVSSGGYRLWDYSIDAGEDIAKKLSAAENGPVMLRFTFYDGVAEDVEQILKILSDQTKYFIRTAEISDRPID